jgi:hypothetical protein
MLVLGLIIESTAALARMVQESRQVNSQRANPWPRPGGALGSNRAKSLAG